MSSRLIKQFLSKLGSYPKVEIGNQENILKHLLNLKEFGFLYLDQDINSYILGGLDDIFSEQVCKTVFCS